MALHGEDLKHVDLESQAGTVTPGGEPDIGTKRCSVRFRSLAGNGPETFTMPQSPSGKTTRLCAASNPDWMIETGGSPVNFI